MRPLAITILLLLIASVFAVTHHEPEPQEVTVIASAQTTSTTSWPAETVPELPANFSKFVSGLHQPRARSAPTRRAYVAAGAVWDRLAQCESGGNWQAHTGNGYEGGLQFHPSTWWAYKDDFDPPHAYQASRERQIAVAEKVLRVQGWAAWPVCSRKAGLR